MERIQSAIQRARAAREAQQAGQSTAPAAAVGGAEGSTPAAAPLPAEAVSAAWTALPVYEPLARRLLANRIVTLDPGPQATPFDVMRTRLLKQMKAHGWKRIAITSPGPACGKTMVTLNLAFSLARQAEVCTMVIEADLRRPALAATLGLKEQQAFATVMQGANPARDHLLRYGPNLAFGTNHRPVQNPAELLHSAKVIETLDALEADYAPDVMLFDMPPLQAGDDTLAFLDKIDAAILVAAAGTTTVEQVDLAEQELAAHTNVIGVVLNKCRYLDKDQGYGDYHYA